MVWYWHARACCGKYRRPTVAVAAVSASPAPRLPRAVLLQCTAALVDPSNYVTVQCGYLCRPARRCDRVAALWCGAVWRCVARGVAALERIVRAYPGGEVCAPNCRDGPTSPPLCPLPSSPRTR